MIINTRKKQLRILSSKKREVIKKNDKNSSYKLTKIITKIKELKKINYIASFISIKTEISTTLLNNYLISLGKKICLPVILNDNKHLIFRSYNKQSILDELLHGSGVVVIRNVYSKEDISTAREIVNKFATSSNYK